MSKKQSVKDFVQSAAGRFEGGEQIVVDPAQGTTLEATGFMRNEIALGGMAIDSTYRQEMAGGTGIQCKTLIRFNEAGDATMIWTPDEGEPAIYRGKLVGATIDVSKTDENGITQRIRTDYTDGSSVTNQMVMEMPGSDAPMTLFSGAYKRRGPVKGRQIWRDLTVEDADRARDFYSKVFALKPQAFDMGGYSDYHMLDHEGESVFGICHARGVNADLPPVWLPYFAVDDAHEARRLAEEAGGSVIAGPQSYDRYTYFVLADPTGAAFIACEGG